MLLVTGATGLLGNCIVRELLQRGEKVRVYVRGHVARAELAGLGVEVVQGELDDRRGLRQAAQDCQAVIHSAAMIHIGYTRLAEARRANVEGSKNVAEICRELGCRLVYVSTVDTLPSAVSAARPLDEQSSGVEKTACTYVLSKREAEAEVAAACAAGLDAVIVHPGFMLGPYDWKPSSGALMLTVYKAPVVVAPRGTASVCDARDVAAAIAGATTGGRSGEHYILAGINIGYPELFERMLQVMHRRKRVYRMGPVIPAAACIVDTWVRLTGAREGLFNGAAIAMGHLHHAYDSSKAQRELNYQCRPLEQTLSDAWEWLQEHFL
jgi:dihydroflavonol-4-reductase